MADRFGLPQARVGLPEAVVGPPDKLALAREALRRSGGVQGAPLYGNPTPWVDAPETPGGTPGLAGAMGQWARENPLDAGALALSFIPGYGDAIGIANDMRHYATDPESRTWLNYGLTGLSAVPGIPPMMGIFAGPAAKTANLAKLAKAMELKKAGDAAENIYRKTGWFEGVDGKWRFEIDDSAMRLTGKPEGKMQEVLEHRELYDAYPEVRDMDVALDPDPKYSASVGGGVMKYNPGAEMSSLRRTFAHEGQHIVQDIEGMSPGASPTTFRYADKVPDRIQDLEKAYEAAREAADRMAEQFQKTVAGPRRGPLDAVLSEFGFGKTERLVKEQYEEFSKLSVEARRRWNEFRAAKNEFTKTRARHSWDEMVDIYRRQAGEVEARAAGASVGMTAPERAASFPPSRYDIPPDQQIVRLGTPGGSSAQAASVADDLPMDEASRMARMREMGFDVDAYHGTQSPVDFSEFNTGGSIQDEMGEVFDSGSGADPSSFMGAHFALEPGPANKFAEGRGAAWMKARVIEGAGDGAGGRVMPVKVRGKFKEFADDDAVQAYIYRQPVNSADVEEAIMQLYDRVVFAVEALPNGALDAEADLLGVDYDEDAAGALFSQYENSPTFREEINRDVMDTLMRESEDGGRSFAAELGTAARLKLEAQGFDGFRHKNTVEGGAAVAVFDPKNIRSRFARFDPRKADSADIMAGVAGVGGAGLLANALRDYRDDRDY